MPYSGKMNFADLALATGARGNALLNALRDGKVLYDKWYALTYGLTDAQIIALPQFNIAGETITQADVTSIKYALGVFNDLAAGNALVPATRDGYLTPFL